MSRLKRKFGYDISYERVNELTKKYRINEIVNEQTISVAEEDWEDVVFTIRYKTSYYIHDVQKANNSVAAKLVSLVEDMRFVIIKPVNELNHPWLMEDVLVGEVFKYKPGSVYGSINRYQGLPLKMGEGVSQINFDCLSLAAD